MPKQQKPKDGINVNITGDVSGQIVVGNNNSVTKSIQNASVTPAELDELRKLLDELRSKVQAEAGPDKKDAALERVDELEQAAGISRPVADVCPEDDGIEIARGLDGIDNSADAQSLDPHLAVA